MKRLSLGVTVLWLASVPLVAAAFDYGPSTPLLAENSGSSSMPDADAASHGAIPRAGMQAATSRDDDGTADADRTSPSPLPQRVAPSAASPQSAPVRPHTDAAARNGPHAPVSRRTPATASWQSLLPGSIQ